LYLVSDRQKTFAEIRIEHKILYIDARRRVYLKDGIFKNNEKLPCPENIL